MSVVVWVDFAALVRLRERDFRVNRCLPFLSPMQLELSSWPFLDLQRQVLDHSCRAVAQPVELQLDVEAPEGDWDPDLRIPILVL
jgi:hypothetical protein